MFKRLLINLNFVTSTSLYGTVVAHGCDVYEPNDGNLNSCFLAGLKGEGLDARSSEGEKPVFIIKLDGCVVQDSPFGRNDNQPQVLKYSMTNCLISQCFSAEKFIIGNPYEQKKITRGNGQF